MRYDPQWIIENKEFGFEARELTRRYLDISDHPLVDTVYFEMKNSLTGNDCVTATVVMKQPYNTAQLSEFLQEHKLDEDLQKFHYAEDDQRLFGLEGKVTQFASRFGVALEDEY